MSYTLKLHQFRLNFRTIVTVPPVVCDQPFPPMEHDVLLGW